MKAEIIAEMNDKMLNRRYEIMYLNKQKYIFKISKSDKTKGCSGDQSFTNTYLCMDGFEHL